MVFDPYKFNVKLCLEESGYSVCLIDEVHDSKRADLLATCDTDSLIIEVKCKYDDKDLYEQLKIADPLKIIPYHVYIERKNSLSSIIEEASMQIEESRYLSKDAFSVIWFHPNPKLGFFDSDEQIRMNLYGGQYAFVDGPDGKKWCMPCYYTTYTDFYRYTSIEAVALDIKEGVQLLTNPFSKRAENFKNSKLYNDFKSHSAIWTPELFATNGEALCAKLPVDLKDPKAVCNSLEQHNPGYKIIRLNVGLQSIGGMLKS